MSDYPPLVPLHELEPVGVRGFMHLSLRIYGICAKKFSGLSREVYGLSFLLLQEIQSLDLKFITFLFSLERLK